MIGPNDFIPLAEEIGLIGLLGDWVLRRACRTAASWPVPRHGKPLQISLYTLGYFSRNAIDGSALEIRTQMDDILIRARRNNAGRNITGALIFSDGCFAQILEGPREDIEMVFESIQCDIRHCDVTILQMQPAEQRSFGAWSMAFGGIEGVSLDPGLQNSGKRQVDDILTTAEGQNLLSALRSVVHRDDIARRDAHDAP